MVNIGTNQLMQRFLKASYSAAQMSSFVMQEAIICFTKRNSKSLLENDFIRLADKFCSKLFHKSIIIGIESYKQFHQVIIL